MVTAVKDQNREVAVQCELESSFASLEGKWHVVSTIIYETNDINLRGKSKSRYQTMLRWIHGKWKSAVWRFVINAFSNVMMTRQDVGRKLIYIYLVFWLNLATEVVCVLVSFSKCCQPYTLVLCSETYKSCLPRHVRTRSQMQSRHNKADCFALR